MSARARSLLVGALLLGCRPRADALDGDATSTHADTDTSGESSSTLSESESESESGEPCPPVTGCLDIGDPGPWGDCSLGDGDCNQIDVLIVLDNSGTMGEEQVRLAAWFPALIDTLVQLQDHDGVPQHPSVHLMVTSTDMGHPACDPFVPDGYVPLRGAPQTVPCTSRLDDFTGLGPNPPSFPDACLLGCTTAVVPSDPFISFSGVADAGTFVTNVPGDDLAGALGCVGPQGINGCGFESPLEAVLAALDPAAPWNAGNEPFLRADSAVVVLVISDEADCSTIDPAGFAHFIDDDTYWAVNPDTGTKTHATSATCWHAGVDCGVPDGNGVYADCSSVDNGVLHPTARYLARLRDELRDQQNRGVYFIGMLGVPPVTEHNVDPPFEPIAGGVHELVYRQWRDEPWPVGDMLPGDVADAAHKQFEFGIGPGCTGEDGLGGFTGQAIPPVRMREVCESLDEHCCIESICDDGFDGVLGCVRASIGDIIIEPW